jgi:hypothetical protein
MIDIQIRSTNAHQVAKEIADIERKLDKPTEGLESATHNVAKVFKHNYDFQGADVGGWDELADYTLNIREWQGVPAGPILFRYGALREISTEFFEKAKAGSTETAGGSYPFKTWSEQAVTGQLTINDKTATLKLSGGYKLLNQWGHPNWGPMSDVPARPFWFVNETVINAAREGVEEWIKDKVAP